ncbi:hypothetical protein H4696_003367 [Amycolatopsis lexingtonensis]|uniref:Uncharacterized protein n=1 Tax=Amycolatopsis lexingtonensis TaxID=218822 RepID=A0ABR9I001_9PSEU|nr:hypothetical protein [Amycolatopsis lexingtonensis]MBE1496267.1 hypothetical protein [Amycolatopsis lexingtonensis]
MTEQPERRAGDLHVSHHRFFLIDDSAHLSDITADLQWEDQRMATTGPGALAVNTEVHTGLINLVVERHTVAPPPDPGRWETIEEHRIDSSTGRLRPATLFNPPPPELYAPVTGPPGDYIVRVHRHIHEVVDDPAFDPAESYLLQCWPKTTDN